ncbi:hypothetical protein [Geopseudomonas aromaticivorans]
MCFMLYVYTDFQRFSTCIAPKGRCAARAILPRPAGEVCRALDHFARLNLSPIGLGFWACDFLDHEIGEVATQPSESLEDATRRHYRKLEAILKALEADGCAVPEFECIAGDIRRQLKRRQA